MVALSWSSGGQSTPTGFVITCTVVKNHPLEELRWGNGKAGLPNKKKALRSVQRIQGNIIDTIFGKVFLLSIRGLFWQNCETLARDFSEKPIHKYPHTDLTYLYFGYGPFPGTVTTRIITFLVGNPYKPLFDTVTGKGPHPTYTLIQYRHYLKHV